MMTYRSFEPPTLVSRPNPLMKRSFLWSSHKMRIWLYLLRSAQQYRNSDAFVTKATPTAMTDGRWKVPNLQSISHLAMVMQAGLSVLLSIIPRCELLDRLHNQYKRHCRHQKAKSNVASRFYTGLATRVQSRIHAVDCPMAKD